MLSLFFHHFLSIELNLTREIWDKLILSNDTVFANFYSPTSFFSKYVQSHFSKAAKRFKNIHFLNINCDVFSWVCDKFSIIGLPTFLYFPEFQNQTYIQYTLPRTADSITDFIETQSYYRNFSHSHIHRINPISYYSFINTSECNILIFGNTWYRSTKDFRILMRKVAKIFSGDKNVNFGFIDCKEYFNICYNEIENLFPVAFFSNERVKYSSRFETVEEAVFSINDFCGTFRSVDGTLLDSAGINEIDEENIVSFSEIINNSTKKQQMEWVKKNIPEKCFLSNVMNKIVENGKEALEGLLNVTKKIFESKRMSRKAKDQLNMKLNLLNLFKKTLI